MNMKCHVFASHITSIIGLCDNLIYKKGSKNISQKPGRSHNTGNCLKLKPCNISCIPKISFNCPITLKFSTEHDSIRTPKWLIDYDDNNDHHHHHAHDKHNEHDDIDTWLGPAAVTTSSAPLNHNGKCSNYVMTTYPNWPFSRSVLWCINNAVCKAWFDMNIKPEYTCKELHFIANISATAQLRLIW